MPAYAGMTVNEKLVISAQMAEWDGAVAKRDRARIIDGDRTDGGAGGVHDRHHAGQSGEVWVPAGEGVKRLLRHCERSEAIHLTADGTMDCFVAALLAMTAN
ncbi:hypothetical protein [Bradyrhizobium sp. Ash2021]|uniref:hypothetical protein n=1 Tax=Bradyrhizobium sp. Ash2021 TaxID=2954771 RepID=UPI002814E77F|nr:hypothetical protein [Bradyrhizobium sp. Ash2021]WMT71550.1 hypothetical protein NL528_26035 [Bradyrhizobium sp. Ash2021]